MASIRPGRCRIPQLYAVRQHNADMKPMTFFHVQARRSNARPVRLEGACDGCLRGLDPC